MGRFEVKYSAEIVTCEEDVISEWIGEPSKLLTSMEGSRRIPSMGSCILITEAA